MMLRARSLKRTTHRAKACGKRARAGARDGVCRVVSLQLSLSLTEPPACTSCVRYLPLTSSSSSHSSFSRSVSTSVRSVVTIADFVFPPSESCPNESTTMLVSADPRTWWSESCPRHAARSSPCAGQRAASGTERHRGGGGGNGEVDGVASNQRHEPWLAPLRGLQGELIVLPPIRRHRHVAHDARRR